LAERKALSWLNVLSGDPCKIDRSEVEEDLEAQKAKTDAVTRRMIELERQMRETQDELRQQSNWDK